MTSLTIKCSCSALALGLIFAPSVAMAQEPTAPVTALETAPFATETVTLSHAVAEAMRTESEGITADTQSQSQAPSGRPAGASGASGAPPAGMPKIVFDENWLSVGVGAGLVPSYSGSDDYILFPLPLIVGRVGGVGLRPNGPGIRLDLLSPAPALGPNQKTTFNFGPAIRFRNDRAQQIEDEVVELAEDLDVALEVGLAGGVTFPGVLNSNDSLTLNTQVRWDILGAHEGMLVEPTVGYSLPLSRAILFQGTVGLQFVDDSFADYYFTVTPDQSAATGLPLFEADGGLNSVSATAIVNFDLDGNALNGGFSIYSVMGYTRLVGDAANTPFTDLRGSANQFIFGVGVGYTF
jgi:outer membrane protein